VIVTCPTCGNSGDWCQSCDGIGKIVAPEAPAVADRRAWASIAALEAKHSHLFTPHEMLDLSKMAAKYEPSSDATGSIEDIQPKPGKTAPGPVPTRRKK